MTQQAIERRDLFWKAGCAAAAIVGIAAVAFLVRQGQWEVRLGQRVLRGLTKGDPRVSRLIHWEALNAWEADLGENYRRLPNDQEQRAYERSFITQFAEGFRQAKGSVRALTRWRVQGRQGGQTVVAVDDPPHGKTLLLSIGTGTKQLEALQWQ